ncbi:COP9 signalosome complex subunit 5 [Pleurostoma richardsiae]|uniref:COP9 signalosome complex subunit 5 n=1 Tax=Pleurostoma richardsiae TaxID=41990 RepID=A0AA38RL96_9PEZI|nr:COP9 signalosome complex subunit 5 [Pleurostoma richardsiae]
MESAMRSWELDNGVQLVDPTRDSLYNYDCNAQKDIRAKKPWKADPHYFRAVRISAIALIKMVMHARSGGSIEVMGLMQGFVDGPALVITDAFRLPVEGTETRVNAQEEANEYMVEYPRLAREQGRDENLIGWYHSHPGYGCWLSGIDVGTQHQWQMFEDPFVAVVVDPDRTISAGKVEIGAFRTYPDDYKASSSGGGGTDGYQTVPLAKAEDFGAHASRYYSMDVEVFKSTVDTQLLELLWNKYWVQTLSQTSLLTNREYGNKQMLDLGFKIKEATGTVQRLGRNGGQSGIGMSLSGTGNGQKQLDQALDKVVRDSKQIAAKEQAGLMAIDVKTKIFNGLAAKAP